MVPNLWYLWENDKCVQSSIAGSSPAQGVHNWLEKIRIAKKKLQKVSDFEKAAYQHGMNSPKAAMSLTTPEAVSISQMSLSGKSSVEKIVYQQLCMFFLMKKRAAAERGAYLWHSNFAETFLSGRRKTSSTSVDFYPNYSLHLPEISTNGNFIYSHQILSWIHNTLNGVTCDRDFKKTSISIQIFVLIFFRGRCMNSLCSVQARVCGCSYF